MKIHMNRLYAKRELGCVYQAETILCSLS